MTDDQEPGAPDEPSSGRRHHHTPRGWGAGIEQDLPGSRFGLVLMLLLVTFVFMAIGFTGDWVPLVTVILQGVTLLATLAASESSERLVRVALVIVVLGVIAGTFALVDGGSDAHGYSDILSLTLIAVAPYTIARAIIRRRVVDIHTVLGAICIYVLFGMFFAFVFSAIGSLGRDPFFVQEATATTADYLYFSFVTLCTVGYGDLTAAGGLGRAMAVFDALIGQIYLVTVLALLVSQLGRLRHPRDSDN